MFSTVTEVAITAAVDDRARLGRAALRPYVLAAFELDTRPGEGQVDGGATAGKYLEVGVQPTFTARGVGVAFPVKVGTSLGGYYEIGGADHTFGYASVGSMATIWLGRSPAGAWQLRGGGEYQRLGNTPKVFNGGDASVVTGSIGIGWSR